MSVVVYGTGEEYQWVPPYGVPYSVPQPYPVIFPEGDDEIAAEAVKAVLELAKANREAIAELRKEIEKLKAERGKE